MNSTYSGVAALICGLMICSPSFADDKPTFTRDGHTTDSLSKVRKQLKAGKATLLDVREQNEWDEGHLKSARLLPLSILREGKLSEKQKKLLPKDAPIYCHCRSGGRVLAVAKILKAKGIDIRPLKSGYADLVKAGFEKAKATPPRPE